MTQISEGNGTQDKSNTRHQSSEQAAKHAKTSHATPKKRTTAPAIRYPRRSIKTQQIPRK